MNLITVLLILCCFTALMFILAVGSARTRMLVFTPLALLPPLLLLFGSLLPFDEALLFFFLPASIISMSGVFTIVGLALLLSPSLNRSRRLYFSISTVMAGSPLLMLAFNAIARAFMS